MTKTTARILALICALGTMLLLFQARVISPAEGKHVLIYSVPGDRAVDSDVGNILEAGLTEKHGEAEATETVGTMAWKDGQVDVLERIDHEIEVMGVSFSGDRYFSCTVRTTRNAVSDKEKILIAADHAITYMAVDPVGEEGVSILWDTMQEETSGKWDQIQLSK